MSHQDKLKRMWDKRQSIKRDPSVQFHMPGPGHYETKDFMHNEPSFNAPRFSKATRPLNSIQMGKGMMQ